MAPPLNHKQKRFALEYRVDHNATESALRAGYSSRGASVQGARLLADVRIRALIDAADEKVLAKVTAAGDSVLSELSHFAHSDLAEAFNEDHTFKHIRDMPDGVRRSIKSVEFIEYFEGASGEKFCAGRVVKLQLWPKDRGLEMLGNNRGLFKKTVTVEAGASFTDLLTAVIKEGG